MKKYKRRDERLIDEGFDIGIDEAGRGPVIGPMIYGAAIWPHRCTASLASIGFKDSKQIKTQEQREEFFKAIEEVPIIEYKYKVISAEMISNTALGTTSNNLNTLSQESAISLIREFLESGVKINRAYIDAVGSNDKYRRKLERRFEGHGIKFVVESKADDNYPVTSAASVVAKVHRDWSLENWKYEEKLEKEDHNFGSGYTSKPETSQWLERNWHPLFGFPNVIRFNWSTVNVNFYHKKGFQIDHVDTRSSKDLAKLLMNKDSLSAGPFMSDLSMSYKFDF